MTDQNQAAQPQGGTAREVIAADARTWKGAVERERAAHAETRKALEESARKHEMWVERADKAEAERDALRAELKEEHDSTVTLGLEVDALRAERDLLAADPRRSAPKWVALGESWPAERRLVLVQIAGNSASGDAPAVGVGYVRIYSNGPFFVVPGARTGFVVTHWADYLGNDFHARPARAMPEENQRGAAKARPAEPRPTPAPARAEAVSERAKAFREVVAKLDSIQAATVSPARLAGLFETWADAAEGRA